MTFHDWNLKLYSIRTRSIDPGKESRIHSIRTKNMEEKKMEMSNSRKTYILFHKNYGWLF